jgi:hypothetical protein
MSGPKVDNVHEESHNVMQANSCHHSHPLSTKGGGPSSDVSKSLMLCGDQYLPEEEDRRRRSFHRFTSEVFPHKGTVVCHPSKCVGGRRGFF